MTFRHKGYPSHCPSAHDPDSSVWYYWVWTDWLPPETEIVSSEWVVPDSLTKDDEVMGASILVKEYDRMVTYENANGIRISGLVQGESYEITNRITTSDDQVQDKTMIITCNSQ